MPILDTSKIRSSAFRPIYKKFYWMFIFNFMFLTYLGAMPAEEPFVILAQLSTFFYFSYFLIITPLVGWLENYLFFNSQLQGRK